MITAIEAKRRADEIHCASEMLATIEELIRTAVEQGLYEVTLPQFVYESTANKFRSMIFDYIRDHGFEVIESPEEVIVVWGNVEEQKGEYHDGTE